MKPAPPGPNVAVLVVHGVADQQPGESARAIAGLLAQLNTADKPRYATFTEDTLRIDVEAPAVSRAGTSETFYECVKTLKGAAPVPHTGPSNVETHPGIVMMHQQLQQYTPEGEDSVYRTVRVSARRVADNARVDVHEMYWADLSRLGQGALRVFGELYQLLLHVPHLGRHAVDAAAMADAASNASWTRLQESQRWAAWVLTVPIPLLNLWLLGCILVGLSGLLILPLSPALRPALPVLIAGLAALVFLAIVLVRRKLPFGAWVLPPVVLVLLTGGLYWLLLAWPALSYQLLAVESIAAFWAGGTWLLKSYVVRRPDCQPFGRLSLGLATLAAAGSLAVVVADPRKTDHPIAVLTAGMRAAEAVYLILALAFLAFFVIQALAWLDGRRAVGSLKADCDVADRVRRAERTARLTLAIPAVSFIVVTMVLWAGLYATVSSMAPVAPYESLWLHLVASGQVLRPGSSDEFLKHADAAWELVALSTPELLVLLALSALAILFALWGTLPVVIAEIRPTRDVEDDPQPLALWLDRGIRYLRFSGTLIIVASFLVLPIITVAVAARLLLMAFAVDLSSFGWLAASSTTILKGLGTLVAGTAIGVFAFGGRLKSLSGGLRPVLDVLLDVDNYLREHPLTNNPRARIVARYLATLNHLCRWKDSQGRPYDRILIVSHSQGTVITSDLLRYLKRYPEDSIARLTGKSTDDGPPLSLRLFTMGSPLRQLYGLRFPHFYDWARHLDTEGCASCVEHSESRHPDPAGLGVDVWVNAYRSGDYIGRHLWHTDNCPDAFVMSPRPTALKTHGTPPVTSPRQEYCVGSGAHTHYWDRTAPTVGDLLDLLI